MKPGKYKGLLTCLLFLLIFNNRGIPAQPAGVLTRLQQKYAGQPVVTTAKRLDVTITLKDQEPLITLESYKELTVLADNSAYLANALEYFSHHYKVNKLEAYSLVPEQSHYRKVAVTGFTKSVEMENSIYYDDLYAYRYTFPAVMKGTRLITRYMADFTSNYLPVVFEFGGTMPCENMEITVTCPKSVQIHYHLFGKDTTLVRFNRKEKRDQVIYTWQADNPRVYTQDPESPDLRYFLPHLIIQLAGYTVDDRYVPVIGSLKDLYAFNYSNISSLPVLPTPDVKALSDSVAGSGTNREKVRNIFRWVQKNIRYVAIEDGNNGLVPQAASVVLNRRYGDCKDKTSLLVAMIRAQGLRASYAWIGSRDLPYKYSVFPSLVNDDHMIAVWWDEQNRPVMLDGTTYSHSLEEVPAFIQGKECMIEKDKENFELYSIPVASPDANAIYDSVSIRLSGDTVRGRGFARFTGEQKANLISMFEGKDSSAWPGIVLRQLPNASNKLIIKYVKISDVSNVDVPFTIRYDFALPDYLTITPHNVYINLYLNRFLQNLIVREDRLTPFESDMTLDHRFVCTMQLPHGFKIKELPQSADFEDPGFSFHEHYSEQGKHVILKSRIILDFQVIDGPELNKFREMLSILNKNYAISLPLEKSGTL